MYVSCVYVHDTLFPAFNVYSGYSAACTFHVSVSTTPSLHNSSSQRACISTPLEMQHACKTEHEPHCPVWPYRKGTLIPTKGPATSEPRNVCKRQISGDSAGAAKLFDRDRNIDLKLLATGDKPVNCYLPRLHMGGGLEADDPIHVLSFLTGPCLDLVARVFHNYGRPALTFLL